MIDVGLEPKYSEPINELTELPDSTGNKKEGLMSRPKYLASTILLLVLGVLVLTTAFAIGQSASSQKKETTQEQNWSVEKSPDFSRFPIVDFYAPEPSEPSQRAARHAKGSKFNSRFRGPQIEENTRRVTHNDWDVRLPALPVAQSAAVIVGTVKSAKAYLSPDKTAVYSEFEVAVDNVIKDDSNNPIKPDSTITVERSGGRVRMPLGSIVVHWITHQNMPQEGGKYVFFLTYHVDIPNYKGKDLVILTGYELRNGLVELMDDTQPGHPMNGYVGLPESKLLGDLFDVIASSSQTSK